MSENKRLWLLRGWAFDRVRRRTQPPCFERQLYEEDSEQAGFLLDVCAEAGATALTFGKEVFEAGLERLGFRGHNTKFFLMDS